MPAAARAKKLSRPRSKSFRSTKKSLRTRPRSCRQAVGRMGLVSGKRSRPSCCAARSRRKPARSGRSVIADLGRRGMVRECRKSAALRCKVTASRRDPVAWRCDSMSDARISSRAVAPHRSVRALRSRFPKSSTRHPALGLRAGAIGSRAGAIASPAGAFACAPSRLGFGKARPDFRNTDSNEPDSLTVCIPDTPDMSLLRTPSETSGHDVDC